MLILRNGWLRIVDADAPLGPIDVLLAISCIGSVHTIVDEEISDLQEELQSEVCNEYTTVSDLCGGVILYSSIPYEDFSLLFVGG